MSANMLDAPPSVEWRATWDPDVYVADVGTIRLRVERRGGGARWVLLSMLERIVVAVATVFFLLAAAFAAAAIVAVVAGFFFGARAVLVGLCSLMISFGLGRVGAALKPNPTGTAPTLEDAQRAAEVAAGVRAR